MYIINVEDFVTFFRGVGWDWVHLVRRALIGLLCQPRMIDEYGQIVGMWMAGKTDVLGENLPTANLSTTICNIY
jgi:hypothetical protein